MPTEFTTAVQTIAIPAGLSYAEFGDFMAVSFKTAAELIAEAGRLNNAPALVNTDHVSIMGMMTREEMVRHVVKLRSYMAEAA